MSIFGHGADKELEDQTLATAVHTAEEVQEATRQRDILELTGRVGAFPGSWRVISDTVRHDEHPVAEQAL